MADPAARAARAPTRATPAATVDRRHALANAIQKDFDEAKAIYESVKAMTQRQKKIDKRLAQVEEVKRQLTATKDQITRQKNMKSQRIDVLNGNIRDNRRELIRLTFPFLTIERDEREEREDEREHRSENPRNKRNERGSECGRGWRVVEGVAGERAPVIRVEAAERREGEEGHIPPRPPPVRHPGRKRPFRDSSVSSQLPPVAGPPLGPPLARRWRPNNEPVERPVSCVRRPAFTWTPPPVQRPVYSVSSCTPPSVPRSVYSVSSCTPPPVRRPVYSVSSCTPPPVRRCVVSVSSSSSSSPSSHSVASVSSTSSSDDFVVNPPPPRPVILRRSQRIRGPPVRYQSVDFRPEED